MDTRKVKPNGSVKRVLRKYIDSLPLQQYIQYKAIL